MDSDYIQFVRYKLQKRLKRLNTSSPGHFHYALRRTWGFLQENEITKGILEDLERRAPESADHAEKILGGTHLIELTEFGNDAIAYWVMKKCAESSKDDIETIVGRSIRSLGDTTDSIEVFREAYVEALFDYIDEQIDDKRMVLALLRRYKNRCEWFPRGQLLAKWTAATREGETILAVDLYEYLHDQGLQFHIEPQSASGRIDLISAQSGKDRLVADAKIFNPDRGQNISYLAKGFRQIYEYTKDYNEPFGYLVIFKTCAQDLSIATPRHEFKVPFVTHNNKTIFLLIIDICDYPESASKRGKLKGYEITPAQLIEAVTAAPATDRTPPDPA